MTINFDASMTEDDYSTGELFHREADKKRFMAMSVALTRKSDQLKEAFKQDPAAFIDLVDCGIAALDHFENVLDLLSGAVARLGAVTNGYSAPRASCRRWTSRRWAAARRCSALRRWSSTNSS